MGQRTNKSERENIERQKHKQLKQLRRIQPSLERDEPKYNQNEKLLIVCEGTNTEPTYFEFFRYSTAAIEKMQIIGTGFNTLSLVEYAEKLKNTKYQDYKVWCVFDADPKPDNPKQLENFNNAIFKAEKLGFKCAYSHQAFEYWIILHFEDHQGFPMHRDLYYEKINKYLKKINPKAIYDKDNKIVTEEIFNILLGIDAKIGKSRKIIASERAEKIYNKCNHSNPAAEESSTTVFELVRILCPDE